MSGTRTGFILQARDRRLLSEVAVLKMMDREQAKLVAPFRSTTRANARLLALTNAGLLKRLYLGSTKGGAKAFYSLTPLGARQVGARAGIGRKSKLIFSSDPYFQHQRHVNELYLQIKYKPIPGGQFIRHLIFNQPLSPAISLVPDSYFEISTNAGIASMFVEVDLETEGLKIWTKKTGLYLRLATTGAFSELFQKPRFRVLVVCESPKRLAAIARTVARQTSKLFFFSTFDAINRDGLWSSIWLRPEGDCTTSLLEGPSICATASTAGD